jgi:hypothetical protein
MPCSLEAHPALAAFLAGRTVASGADAVTGVELKTLCDAEDLHALLRQRIRERGRGWNWPAGLLAELDTRAHAEAAVELLRAHEIRAVLAGLADCGIRPILLKGTALAYTIYPSPASRPRSDTDVLIAPGDVVAAREVLASFGYAFTVHCSDLFSQFEAQKLDRFGVQHVFDVHWKISSQSVFEDMLRYGRIFERARSVPLLGPHAIALNDVDALLLACVHPVMHHRKDERVLWMFDVHLLAERLSADQFDEFATVACTTKVAAICLHQLRRVQTLFSTRVPVRVLARLAGTRKSEPSADYLASERRWHDELFSSVRGLPSIGPRSRLLRKVLMPSHDYMLGMYGLRGKPLASFLLPALYLHRNVRGAWRILTGRK